MFRIQATRNSSAFRQVLCAGLVFAALQTSLPALGQTANQVPNPEFRGNQGAVAGNVAGDVPSAWRGFAVGTSAIDLSTLELAAGALFPDSPPVHAIRLETTDFGGPSSDSGVDHNAADFSLFGDRSYVGEVYLRSANADNSAQMVSVSMPVFDQTGAFTGDQPGSFNAEAGSGWQRFSGPAFTGTDGFSALMAFRLLDDGGDNAVWIALPGVDGPVLTNRLPNPEFGGSDGFVQGNVSGEIPDDWRAFAIDGASIGIAKLPLAADAVFAGSPAATAVEVAFNLGAGTAGFDHEPTQVPATPPGYHFRVALYMRSGNSDGSAQTVFVNTPVFDSGGFTGRFPGLFSASVDDEWRLYVGPTFAEQPGTTVNLAITVDDDAGEDIVQMAFPKLLGLDALFVDGFE